MIENNKLVFAFFDIEEFVLVFMSYQSNFVLSVFWLGIVKFLDSVRNQQTYLISHNGPLLLRLNFLFLFILALNSRFLGHLTSPKTLELINVLQHLGTDR